MAYLRKVANRGAETHALMKSQDATIDRKRCEGAFAGINDDIPADSAGSITSDWQKQVSLFFVDSCVSGKPKPVPGDAVTTPSSSPSTTPSS